LFLEEAIMSKQRPKVGVGALILRRNHLGQLQMLLAQRLGSHGAGSYGSVGGHLEFGESPPEGLKREAREELGVELGNLEFIACTNFIVEQAHYVDLGFKADIIAGEPTIQPAEIGKLTNLGWYALDNLPAPLFAPLKVYLQAIRSEQRFFEVDSPAE
jgi:8-oxo-dGTP diphosphatase